MCGSWPKAQVSQSTVAWPAVGSAAGSFVKLPASKLYGGGTAAAQRDASLRCKRCQESVGGGEGTDRRGDWTDALNVNKELCSK